MVEEQSVREKLLEAARKEFLSNGYAKASLRKICKDANVTTGALYFFFKNKEDLFTSVVTDTAKQLQLLVRRQTDDEINGRKTSIENESEFIEFLFRHREEFEILFEKAEGTPYAVYKKELCLLLKKGYEMFYEKFGGDDTYREIIDIVLQMRIQGYVALLRGGCDLDKAMKYVRLMAVYGDCGFEGMMKQLQSITKGSVQ